MTAARWLVASCLVLIGLAGCASPPTAAQLVADGSADLADAPLCCKTLADALREPLPLANGKEPTRLAIDRQAQAHVFGGSKAFFRLYELPNYARPYSISLNSQAGGTLQDAALFIPRVAMFDGDFQLTRYFDEKTLRNRGNNLERTIFINPADRHERYIAIYGSDLSSTVERAYSLVTVQTIAAGPMMFNFYSGHDGKSLLRSSPTGQVFMEVREPEASPAAQ